MAQYRDDKENKWMLIALETATFNTWIKVFRRTAEGVRFYVNCTPEQDAQNHKEISGDILKELREIKKTDYGAYVALCTAYKDDIKEAVKVYKESKNGG